MGAAYFDWAVEQAEAAGVQAGTGVVTCAGCMVWNVMNPPRECQRLIEQGLCQKQVMVRVLELRLALARERVGVEQLESGEGS